MLGSETAPVVMPSTGGRKLLLIASSGGHLAELHRLQGVLDPAESSLWVTFDGPQARTLLAGKRVMYLPYIKPRGALAILVGMVLFGWRSSREPFDAAVSTGSGIALACLPITRARGLETTYIESVGRTHGPSVTGRLLRLLPGVRLRTQSPLWARDPWELHPSVLSAYTTVESAEPAPPRPRLFITLGTIGGYRFDALVDAVLALGLADEHTVWQLGETDRDDLPGTVHRYLTAEEYAAAAVAADVVVGHAGVGTLLVLLELGVYPLMVARRAHRGEHVDDHQADMRHLLDQVAVGRVIEVEELTAEAVADASRRSVAHAAPRPVAHPTDLERADRAL